MPTLQEQINAAIAGATIQHDTEFVGNLTIDKPLTIQGSGIIRSPNAGPAVDIPPKTGPVSLLGKSATEPLRITHTTMIYDVIRWGAWQTTEIADVPQGLTMQYCDVFGLPDQNSQRGIALNGKNFLMKDCKVREIHWQGGESQGLCGWNGPGPFKIFDSYIEASTENILFGGADARIPNLIPSDIEVRRCYFFKPMAWRGKWPVKNWFEIKNGRRAVIDGCKFENNWADAQSGFGILFTVRGEAGANPWATVEDVIFTNNELLNTCAGFQLIGKDWPTESQQGSRLRIANNVIRMAQNAELGYNGRLMQIEQFHDVTLENNDANPPHTYLVLTGGQSQRLVYRNNVLQNGDYGIHAGGQPYTSVAPYAVIAGNIFYGNPSAPKIAGNSYFDTKPSSIPAGVGVDLVALKAAQGGSVITPLPSPSPTPTPEPTPEPSPAPAPSPTPIPVLRKVSWPTTETKQNAVVETQWKERYRFKRHLSGAYAEFEKVQ